MKFLKAILWVPMVFGVIMGGLAVAKLVADGIGAEFVAMPARIIESYETLVRAVFFALIELPFDIEVTEFWRNFFTAWFVFGASNVRGYLTVPVVRGGMRFNYRHYEIAFSGLGRSLRVIFEIFFAFVLGPVFTIIFFIFHPILSRGPNKTYRIRSAIGERELERASREASEGIYKELQRIISNDANQKQLANTVRLISSGLNIYVLIILSNPLIAAGLLWWNSAEIARLTAGIG